MEYIVIERTDADQSFHVRFVSGNGKRTFWCENLKTRAAAIKAIIRHAETFVGEGLAKVGAAPLVASGLALRISIWEKSTTINYIEIREIDSRTPKEP